LNNGLIYTPITPHPLVRVVVLKHNYKAYGMCYKKKKIKKIVHNF